MLLREVTRVQRFTCVISNPVLLVTNQTCANSLQNSKKLCRRLSENLLSFLKSLVLIQIFEYSSVLARKRKTFRKKAATNQSLNISDLIFLPKPNMWIGAYRKLKFGIFVQFVCFIYAFKVWERILSCKKFENIGIWRRLE